MSLRALRLIHSLLSAKKIKVADFQIRELLSSFNDASNRHKFFLREKRTEKEHTVRGKKEKLLRRNLDQQRRERRAGKCC